MAPLLEVKNLCVCVKKDGRSFNILNDVSFFVNEGEIAGLAGESGCGKSMTALSITNLLPQAVRITSGEIIYNRDFSKTSEPKVRAFRKATLDLNTQNLTSLGEKELRAVRGSEISYVFQDVRQALNPLMKIGKQITETLELGVRGHRSETREQKINNKALALDLLKALGFNNPQKIFDAYPHQLSGGMCQRIMTAIAVIGNPKLLLADEPSSSLDEESQNQCLSLLLKKNQNEKMSLFVISHDLSIIQNFCSRFIIMYAGRIAEEGQAETLFSPLHPYTRALVNALPYKNKRGQNLENIGGKVPSVEDQLKGCPFAPRCPKAQNICKETFPPDYFNSKDNQRKVYCYFPEQIKKM